MLNCGSFTEYKVKLLHFPIRSRDKTEGNETEERVHNSTKCKSDTHTVKGKIQ